MRLTLLALSVAALVGGCASTPPEADPVQLKLNDLDARITRIERIVANQVEAAQRLDEVQSAVRQLRGRLEELEHGNEALAKQQRDLYADLDKRLAAASGAAGGAATGSATGETAAEGGATSPGAAPGAAAGNAPSSVEQAVYTQAFDALKAGSFSVAIWLQGLSGHLSREPLGGECPVLAGGSLLREPRLRGGRRGIPHGAQEMAGLAQGARCAAEARLHAICAAAIFRGPGHADRGHAEIPGKRLRQARGRPAAPHFHVTLPVRHPARPGRMQ